MRNLCGEFQRSLLRIVEPISVPLSSPRGLVENFSIPPPATKPWAVWRSVARRYPTGGWGYCKPASGR